MTLSAFGRAAFAALAISATALVCAAPALAEVVLHRGNGAEPQTLDQASAVHQIGEKKAAPLVRVHDDARPGLFACQAAPNAKSRPGAAANSARV